MIKWAHPTYNGVKQTYGLISDCERFRIGKFILDDGPVYILFDGTSRLGRYTTAREAQKAAEAILAG